MAVAMDYGLERKQFDEVTLLILDNLFQKTWKRKLQDNQTELPDMVYKRFFILKTLAIAVDWFGESYCLTFRNIAKYKTNLQSSEIDAVIDILTPLSCKEVYYTLRCCNDRDLWNKMCSYYKINQGNLMSAFDDRREDDFQKLFLQFGKNSYPSISLKLGSVATLMLVESDWIVKKSGELKKQRKEGSSLYKYLCISTDQLSSDLYNNEWYKKQVSDLVTNIKWFYEALTFILGKISKSQIQEDMYAQINEQNRLWSILESVYKEEGNADKKSEEKQGYPWFNLDQLTDFSYNLQALRDYIAKGDIPFMELDKMIQKPDFGKYNMSKMRLGLPTLLKQNMTVGRRGVDLDTCYHLALDRLYDYLIGKIGTNTTQLIDSSTTTKDDFLFLMGDSCVDVEQVCESPSINWIGPKNSFQGFIYALYGSETGNIKDDDIKQTKEPMNVCLKWKGKVTKLTENKNSKCVEGLKQQWQRTLNHIFDDAKKTFSE